MRPSSGRPEGMVFMGDKVLIGMSGGVDSSVAALLLRDEGYDCVGVTLKLYANETIRAGQKTCCSLEDVEDARSAAFRLGMPHHVFNASELFEEKVIRHFVATYEAGGTPNPCIECNRWVKWDRMRYYAGALGADFIATGHYARIAEYNGHIYLQTAADTRKDQTYFLWMLTEENLRQTIFPLGGLTKTEVRKIAAEHGFEKLSKKTESQEICFVPDNDYRSFLSKQGCRFTAGNYVDKEGNTLGKHEGYPNYTIGQRKGLGIALGEPRYVSRIDAGRNEVTLASHDDLYANRIKAMNVRIRDWEWLHDDPQVEVRIRYRSQAVPACIEEQSSDETQLCVATNIPVWGVTPGQSLVIYKNGLVVGGGIIAESE